MEWIRDAPVGQIIRYLTKNKVLKYPEEKEDFVCPDAYGKGAETPGSIDSTPSPHDEKEKLEIPTEPAEEAEPVEEAEEPETDLSKIATAPAEGAHFSGIQTHATNKSSLSHVGTRTALHQSRTQKDLEEAYTAALEDRGVSRVIIPEKTAEGVILVDWYTTDDPANPQNWTFKKKMLVTLQICLYTMAVYMGSSIYAPSIPGVIEQFGVSPQLASMGLSMYVLGYGLGPMLFSPLSEIPRYGRNPPYIISFAIFVILTVPTALVDNFPGLIVLRFLLGFFGSPCLATGGASLQDMFSLLYLPFAVCLWAIAATSGPALGPTISGFSVTAENWRWSQWEILWLSGPIWITMFFFLPETNPSTILLQRAQRLRARQGKTNVMSQSEIDQQGLSVTSLILENLYRPLQMMVFDPAVGFTAIYTALIYGIYYSFFEVFPIVYGEYYGMNLGEQGLIFLSITVGVFLAIAAYWTYLYFVVVPWTKINGFAAPERRLHAALVATFLCPIGLFIFGWTARPDASIHWIVPTIGITIFTMGIFIVIQCKSLQLKIPYFEQS